MLENSLTLNPDQQVYEDGVLRYPLMKVGESRTPVLRRSDDRSGISLRNLEQPYKSIFYGVLILSAAIAINLYFKSAKEEVYNALTKQTIEEKTIEQTKQPIQLSQSQIQTFCILLLFLQEVFLCFYAIILHSNTYQS